ncbi:MAG TPA: sigma 54-interacting transcriptional regulator, partial [Blastocatellia bacterium]|nr:sigma 54-interacting transcriptional regulator [Blastocatellia bacterium]
QRRYARERDRLKLLLDVNNAIVSELDLRNLIPVVSAALQEVIPHDFAGLTLYDAESNVLRQRAFARKRPDTLEFVDEGLEIPIEGTPMGKAFTEGRPLLIRRPDRETYNSEAAAQLIEQGASSGCAVPLITRGRKLGVLGIGSLREAAFNEDDLELLAHVSGQVAIAVENALNFERARTAEAELARKLDHLRLLLRVNNAVVSHLDMADLLRVISDCLREVVDHETAGLALFEPEIGKLRVVAQYYRDMPPIAEDEFLIGLEDNPVGLTFTSGRPRLADVDHSMETESGFVKRAREAGVRAACHVPLIAHGRKLGVIGVASVRRDAFTDADLEMLSQCANQIAIAIDNALAYREIESLKNKLSQEKVYLEEEINTAYDFEQIIGTSPALRRILKQVETVAPTDSTVLILGETGTGKELIARAIHSLSGRRDRTLVKLNCAAIPTGLLESELFGHEKGAFTGAIAQRIGRFELANRGTLFLDEVGEIPLDLQPKLLRVLQEQEFERLGSTKTIRVDARLIAATNRDLGQMVADRRYRDDLYYRLNVFPITIPPLRERTEDIPPLVRFFASRSARRMKKRIDSIPADAIARLQAYHWPGNIRELENLMERAAILTQGTELQVPFAEMMVQAKASVSVAAASQAAAPDSGSAGPVSSKPVEADSGSLESVEREHILRVLTETDWVVGGPNGAAARLGLKRTTLQARMKKLGIKR